MAHGKIRVNTLTYDTGSGDVDVAEQDSDVDEKTFAQWDAYFRSLYPKLTIAKINAFASSYKNSDEEE